MKRALLYGLSLALVLSLAACSQPKADHPTEPDPTASTSTPADISTSEPVTTPEPPAPEQLADKTPAAPAENEASQPTEDTTPTEPPAEKEPEPPAKTDSPQPPKETAPAVQTEPTPTEQPADESQQNQQTTDSTPQQPSGVWDQEFYDTLTPEQQQVYKNMPDDSSRNMMKQSILNLRQQEAAGWATDGGNPTEEDLKEAWSHIQMGQ